MKNALAVLSLWLLAPYALYAQAPSDWAGAFWVWDQPEANSVVIDPATRSMQNLRKRRFDIRQLHRNGDPTDVKLI